MSSASTSSTGKPARAIVGTSGWQYADWNGSFYPPEVKGKAQLPYFARHFKSVEINSTFYHAPRLTTVENWAAAVPEDFRFVIKLNRFFTHTKRLTPDEQFDQRLSEFFELLQPLGPKLSAILVQLPPGLRADHTRLEHLAQSTKLPLAVEFRHASWFTDETFALMRRYNLANVINDSPNRWPASTAVTADTAYIRFHGNRELYRSSYTDAELAQWAEFIRTECADCKRILCYFNNDYNAVAIRNARTLNQILTPQ